MYVHSSFVVRFDICSFNKLGKNIRSSPCMGRVPNEFENFCPIE